jgi:hypothetical protein
MPAPGVDFGVLNGTMKKYWQGPREPREGLGARVLTWRVY